MIKEAELKIPPFGRFISDSALQSEQDRVIVAVTVYLQLWYTAVIYSCGKTMLITLFNKFQQLH